MVLENPSTLAGMKLLLIVSLAVGVSGCLLAWRERPEPGAVPLAILLAGQSWWSATLFFRITASGIGDKIFWVNVSWIGIAVIPVAWLLFSLEYTGYTQYVRLRYVALLSIIPALTVVFGLTDWYHGLIYGSSELVPTNGTQILERTPGVWFWVIAGYTYLLGLLGAIPLLQFVTSDVDTFRGQSLAILLGLFAPWVTNALFLMGALPTAGIDPTPVAFTVSGIAYLGALTRFQLFGTSPTPIRQARRQVFKQMQEGALVLDRHNHVVDMNERAAVALERHPSDVLGRSLEQVLPALADAVTDHTTSGRTIFRPEHGQGAYDVSVSDLTDIHHRVTGQIITLHDISDHLRQQQRLEVLNRVFRHNIRSNIQIIDGHTEYLAHNNSERRAETVRQKAAEIEAISEKIRTMLDIFEQQRDPGQPVNLGALLRECVASVREEYPDVTIDCAFDSSSVYVDNVLTDVFLNVIENAAQHNTSADPQVRVEVERGDDYVEVIVADNGPGISENELALVEQGAETPLKHGTGFGLALIVWGTEVIGGTVTFEDNDPAGQVVTVEAPIRSGDSEPDVTARSGEQDTSRELTLGQ